MTFGREFWSIQARFEKDGGRILELGFSWQDGNKLLKLDGIAARQLSSLFDQIKTIYCGPQEPLLINGSPRLRRQYFDLAISQLFPQYIPLLRELFHVIAQRNALLKTEFDSAQKRSWDLSLIKTNTEVFQYRMRYLKLLNEAIQNGPGFVSLANQKPSYIYQSTHKELESMDSDAQMAFLQKLESREKHWQRSLIGCHLDDYDFILDERSMKSFASQGQKQMVAITLKLTQASLIREVTGIRPILLFDDIYAELDAEHSLKVRQFVDDGLQVFVASPRADVSRFWPGLNPVKGIGEVA